MPGESFFLALAAKPYKNFVHQCTPLMPLNSLTILAIPTPVKLDARLNLRLTSITKQIISDAAKRRGRSVNWMAQTILSQWAERQAKKRSKAG